MVDRADLAAEAVYDQAGEGHAHRLVPGPPGKLGDDAGQGVPAPIVGHPRTMGRHRPFGWPRYAGPMRHAPGQADLFAPAAAEPATEIEVDAAFIEDRRRELQALLDKARSAVRLPWKDVAQAWLAEMRFDGLLRWLPEAEAAPLRDAFAAELDRLYAREAPTGEAPAD